MSLQARIVKAFCRKTVKKDGLAGEDLVRHLRKVFDNTPNLTLMPRGTRRRSVRTEGFTGDHIYTDNPGVTILYIHGGAYIAGVPRSYHNLTARMAKALNGEAYLPRYPLAPEHPFPAGINACVAAYRFLLDQGKDPKRIVIAGDSAGGGLTLGTLLKLRDEGTPLPACAVTLSPGANCHPDPDETALRDPTDAMLSADIIRNVVDVYVPDPADRKNPYASPVDGEYTGLPPLMITVSNEEILYGDALKVRAAAEKAAVPVEWLERKGVYHVWPVMVPFVPEARQDLKRILAFIRRQL
jgi:monoterpene epsilon-lactone hydrolase